MLLRQLEYLVALARERHFARAAAACFVSQPSLSAAIRRLEHELDVPIVRRGRRRYEGLTPEGEIVLAWAHRILAERDALHQELSRHRGGLSGTLRLGMVPTAVPVASLLTTPFCERHPCAGVTLQSLSSEEIRNGLAEFELDAAMTYLDDDTLRQVRRLSLYEERYVLLTPVDGPLARRRTGPLVAGGRTAPVPAQLPHAQSGSSTTASPPTEPRPPPPSNRTASPDSTPTCPAAAGPASSPTPGCTCSASPKECGSCPWKDPHTVPGSDWSSPAPNPRRSSPRPW